MKGQVRGSSRSANSVRHDGCTLLHASTGTAAATWFNRTRAAQVMRSVPTLAVYAHAAHATSAAPPPLVCLPAGAGGGTRSAPQTAAHPRQRCGTRSPSPPHSGRRRWPPPRPLPAHRARPAPAAADRVSQHRDVKHAPTAGPQEAGQTQAQITRQASTGWGNVRVAPADDQQGHGPHPSRTADAAWICGSIASSCPHSLPPHQCLCQAARQLPQLVKMAPRAVAIHRDAAAALGCGALPQPLQLLRRCTALNDKHRQHAMAQPVDGLQGHPSAKGDIAGGGLGVCFGWAWLVW